jgi:hypothetical protein
MRLKLAQHMPLKMIIIQTLSLSNVSIDTRIDVVYISRHIKSPYLITLMHVVTMKMPLLIMNVIIIENLIVVLMIIR